jgi:hypothetical protein
MTNQLKTEIEKINQDIKNEEDGEWREILKERKQGIILGAKMIIEEIRKISEEYFNKEYYHDFPKEPFETLEQLNNLLEKE